MSSKTQRTCATIRSRDLVSARYHRLHVNDCPVLVLERLARETNYDATVENVRPVPGWNEWFDSRQAIFPGAPEDRYRIRNAVYDVALSSARFLEHMPHWDKAGVFAILSERGSIPFRASDLDEPARYRALDNFGDWLCFALAGPTTDGTSVIVTPRSDLLDLAESLL